MIGFLIQRIVGGRGLRTGHIALRRVDRLGHDHVEAFGGADAREPRQETIGKVGPCLIGDGQLAGHADKTRVGYLRVRLILPSDLQGDPVGADEHVTKRRGAVVEDRPNAAAGDELVAQ